MIKDILFQIKYTFSFLKFNRKKELSLRLKESFGKLKDDSFDFESIESYFRKKNNSKAYQVLSDKTCNDLDFDDLFMFLDRTNSNIGQQYYYNNLRTIEINEKQTKLNEEIITKLSQNPELRISVQKKIEKLKHKDAYFIASLFQEEHINPPKWFFMIQFLSFTSLVSLILGFFNPIFFIILLGIFCINFVLHYWNKNNLVQYVSSIPQLLRLNNIASHLFAKTLFKKLNPDLPKSIKIINEVKNRMSFFSLEAKLQGEFEIIAWFVFEIFKTMFLLEPLLLFGVLKRLNTKREEIESVFKFVGHIDMLVSIASLRHGLETYCLPIINNGDKIAVKKISHPLIYKCTTNSIEIGEKSILLTGSNMSGKTSFIRAIGLNIITGLTINTCFAHSMTFPLLKVFSAIRINDDLMNNKSYYFEEVVTIKEMLKESVNGNKNLFLLDEIFKGTNTVERISAGKSVLSALIKNNNKILVSTHDLELTDLLSDEYELYHFSETINEKNVDFDYKLKIGKLQKRNAIRILEINDYPKEIVNEAIKIAKELDKTYLAKNNTE
ncbi:DNA mismatch repair protein MutS [Polaribacter vadi]|uniref:MutS-related protein n=1 Tax=Polaribacter TaxID=52959 RepID=UPI001C087C23|nr:MULTISPECIES: DNA mismatch repair protein MutS [Polaribacter]MBU3011801.1 DNA mismatch repair protein MutS [Polaribacter vadi]MDO6741614.1 DNA mismatch repair protein MutS [Polaribacter sp. 1_MG-2023]